MKTHVALFTTILGLAAFFVSTASLSAADFADFILYHGKVITVDSLDNVYQAVAISEGKILQAGTDAEILALAGSQCKMIDLKGKTVTPGLIDSHYHMMYYGQQFWPGYLDIRHPRVTNKTELLQVLSDYASQLEPGMWISGNQGFHLAWDETLDRYDLDAISMDNPMYLRHGSGQYAVVNSIALEIAGIDSNTANPPGARIMHDDQGEPTGILSHYPAENLVAQFATGYGDLTDEQKIEAIEKGQELCLSAGYTTVQDVIIGTPQDLKLYKNYADSGKLKVRLYTMLYVNTVKQAANYAQQYYKEHSPSLSDRYKFGGWKLAQDGGFAAKTILMYDKTLFAASLSYPYFTQDSLNKAVQILHDTGLQVAVHVSGDEGIDMTLTAFEQAMLENPRSDPRHRIEHGLFPSASALQRMKDSNIILSTQPQWIGWHGASYVQTMDEESMSHLLPFRLMLNLGIHVAFGCDVPASLYQEPKYAFYGAAMRRPQSGTVLNPGQKLTAQEILHIHTMGSAYAACADTITGSLEPEKCADLVIWSHDLYNMPANELMQLEAELTMVNGDIVFDAGLNPVTTVTQENYGQNEPHDFLLLQNHPNPFNPGTAIRFQIPVATEVEITIYDLLGQKVRTLANRNFSAGTHSVKWNGNDENDTIVSAGVYMCVMKSDDYVANKKIIFLK